MYMRKVFFLILISFSAFSLFNCESDSKTATLQVWLTDAPGDYEEANIDIREVEIHASEGEQTSGWKSLDVQSGVYDLLKLTNGLDTLLGSIELPAGRISQIRLKLGSNNTLKINGQTVALQTPSAQQTGLKLQIHQDLQEGVVYKILLDFDVARSIVPRAHTGYILKPVIRTIVEAQSGSIKGIVSPAESTPAVYAILGTDTVATGYTDSSGKFLLRGLTPGSYKVSFVPNEAYQPVIAEDIAVTLGNVTDMGTITIEE